MDMDWGKIRRISTTEKKQGFLAEYLEKNGSCCSEQEQKTIESGKKHCVGPPIVLWGMPHFELPVICTFVAGTKNDLFAMVYLHEIAFKSHSFP